MRVLVSTNITREFPMRVITEDSIKEYFPYMPFTYKQWEYFYEYRGITDSPFSAMGLYLFIEFHDVTFLSDEYKRGMLKEMARFSTISIHKINIYKSKE